MESLQGVGVVVPCGAGHGELRFFSAGGLDAVRGHDQPVPEIGVHAVPPFCGFGPEHVLELVARGRGAGGLAVRMQEHEPEHGP